MPTIVLRRWRQLPPSSKGEGGLGAPPGVRGEVVGLGKTEVGLATETCD